MYHIVRTKTFDKSYQRYRRSGALKAQTKNALEDAINVLASDGPLPKGYMDHALKGEYVGYRECHIKGDLLLVYQKRDKDLVLILVDLASHSHLFG